MSGNSSSHGSSSGKTNWDSIAMGSSALGFIKTDVASKSSSSRGGSSHGSSSGSKSGSSHGSSKGSSSGSRR
ncbi:hypothetical protein N0V85_004028 [Neurospora sp. IMI 360204]|uniref:Uncharacterized protein n=1 Tax=Neurospora tetraspora TaxID=94610 RepID=A0AAE0MNV4_9PEZI|nr:hypothetical protein N0V85_004028 [Neurospora sp. IMI 360204]KAK3339483.1 hypothetical protein B0H65DRAFT_552210 [Neurospora tetraspora]